MIEIPIQTFSGTLPNFTVDPSSPTYWQELWAHEQVLNLHAMAQAEMTIQDALDISPLTDAVEALSFIGTVVDLPGLNIKRTGKVVTIEYTP
ncbi:MAG: hypothetical protein PVH19_00105 [Planctomycetia bacterium]|jgi:hypothetical protein